MGNTKKVLIAVAAIIVVGAAVFMGNSSSQKGALIRSAPRAAMPRGAVTTPRPMVAPRPVAPVTGVVVNPVDQSKVIPPTLSVLPFEGNPPANRAIGKAARTVARYEIAAPSQITITGMDVTCNNLHDKTFVYGKTQFTFGKGTNSAITVEGTAPFFKTCGTVGTSANQSFTFTKPVTLSAASRTTLDISMSESLNTSNFNGPIVSFAIPSDGFKWSGADGVARTGFNGGTLLTAQPLKQCEIDLNYSSTSCDYVHPVASSRPYVIKDADTPTGAVLKKQAYDQVLAKFTVSVPVDAGDIVTNQADIHRLFFNVTSNVQANLFLSDLRLEAVGGGVMNPGKPSGSGYLFQSPNPAMFPIDKITAGSSKTYVIKGLVKENAPENMEIKFSLVTGNPPAMGVGAGDGRENSTFAQFWNGIKANNEVVPYYWVEPRGTTIDFGTLSIAK